MSAEITLKTLQSLRISLRHKLQRRDRPGARLRNDRHRIERELLAVEQGIQAMRKRLKGRASRSAP